MANPAIRTSPLADFYVAPQSYDPGQPEQIGREVRLVKGTTTNIDGTGYTFREFNADRSAMLQGGNTILVLTELTITPPDGSKHDLTLKSVFHIDGKQRDSTVSEIPGVTGGRAEVLSVSPNDGSVVVKLTGVSKNPKDEFQAATTESLSVDVTRKPLISLVWGGFYVMMAGALLALVRRAREASRAAASTSEAAESAGRARGTSEPAPAVGPPPVPLHTRSRL
jgi:cytochrome c biogenesis factor